MAINVVKGSLKRFNLEIDNGSDPFDLTNATEIQVCFPGEDEADPGVASLSEGHLTIANAALGKLTGYLPVVESSKLLEGNNQNIEVRVTTSSPLPAEPESVILAGLLNVSPAICP